MRRQSVAVCQLELAIEKMHMKQQISCNVKTCCLLSQIIPQIIEIRSICMYLTYLILLSL